MASSPSSSPISSSSTSATIISSSSPPLTVSATQKYGPHPVSVKLAEDNFLPWKQQTLATIRGHNLLNFLTPTAVPSQYLSENDKSQGNINAAYTAWEQKDQLLLSWLLSSMSDSMLTMMVGCDHASQVWDRLEEFFASQTKAKVRQFKTQLKTLKKGSMKVTEYLLKVKKLVDNLFSVGAPLTVADHIEAILEGLPPDYNSFVVSVTSRTDPYIVAEISSPACCPRRKN